MRKATLLFIVASLLIVDFALAYKQQKPHFLRNTEEETKTEDESFHPSFGLFVMLVCLGLCFIAAYFLHKFHFHYLHESAASIIIGLIVGFFINAVKSEGMEAMAAFDHEIFFLFLLPPIIFESGYNLKRKDFFKNIGSVMGFAMAGTLISTFVIAGLLIASSSVHSLTPLDCFIFGSLISATDPVSVLSIFKELAVDPMMFANVFGESVLNDAVAIVLYRTFTKFLGHELSGVTIMAAIGEFTLIFFGSFVIGVVMALICSLIFRHMAFIHHPNLEVALICVHAYASYMLAEAIELSGIVAVLFAGIVLAHYAYNSLSTEAKGISVKMFSIVALLTETFVFLYIGMAVFSFHNHKFNIGLIVLAILYCFISRALNVFPITYINNFLNKKNPIPRNQMIMLWFAGLRGAIALALSLDVNILDGVAVDAKKEIFTTTVAIVLFTVFLMGGTTTTMLRKLKVPMGVTDEDYVVERGPDHKTPKFIAFDRRYLKPFFTRPREFNYHVEPEAPVQLEEVQRSNANNYH